MVVAFVPSTIEGLKDIQSGLASYTREIECTDVFRINASFESLSDDDRDWLARVHAKLGCNSLLASVREGVAMNQNFLSELASMDDVEFGSDHIDVRSLPRLIAHDWSSEYKTDRDVIIGPILEALRLYVPQGASVFISEAGLCRLAFEVAQEGYACTALERDGLKLMSVHFIVNLMNSGEYRSLQPNILETCNRLFPSENTQIVHVPDVNFACKEIPLTMRNDRVHGKFDVVITQSDRVEVSPNLSEGGIWIHFGNTEPACDGFSILRKELITSKYLATPNSIMSTHNRCVFFVAKRV